MRKSIWSSEFERTSFVAIAQFHRLKSAGRKMQLQPSALSVCYRVSISAFQGFSAVTTIYKRVSYSKWFPHFAVKNVATQLLYSAIEIRIQRFLDSFVDFSTNEHETAHLSVSSFVITQIPVCTKCYHNRSIEAPVFN